MSQMARQAPRSRAMTFPCGRCRTCLGMLYRETWNGPVKGHKPNCPEAEQTIL
jgi:hypothetical protein